MWAGAARAGCWRGCRGAPSWVPSGRPEAAELREAASGGSAVALDKGLRGGRAGFPSLDPEARRPLPAASPASGAGAGGARHLLRIDAGTASRAFPAPGMQRRRRRAGPGLERGRARSLAAGPASRPQLFSPSGSVLGTRGPAGAVGSLSPSPPLPAARRPPHSAAFSTGQELGFGASNPVATSLPLCGPGRSLHLSGPPRAVEGDFSHGWGWPPRVWALFPFPQRSEDQGRGANSQ